MQNIENIQNEEMIRKGVCPPDYDDESDSFASFLIKSVSSQFNGCMTIHNLTQIFPKVDRSNVLRYYCLHVLTDSSFVEIPSTKDITLSSDSNCNNASNVSKPISITLSDEYAKWLIPRSLFYKISGYTDYLKSVFSDSISFLERKIFVKGISTQVPGIQETTEVLNADALLNIIFSLGERYRKDAVFLMSSTCLRQISNQKDNQGRYIFDGVDKLFGYKVEAMDELEDMILFSDFKQSTVIVEKINPKIEMHSNFENPSNVGLSLPVSVGIGIINSSAIVAKKFTTIGNSFNQNSQLS